jgi:undecaprenyl-diphosphatase
MPEADKRDPIPPQRTWWPVRVARGAIGMIRRLLDWIGRHELKVLLAMTGAAIAVLVFIEIADAVGQGHTVRFDQWAVRALRHPNDPSRPVGPAWFSQLARDVTALGGVALLTLVTIAVLGFLWLRRMYGPVWLVLAATLGGLIVSTLLKELFERQRPDIVPHLTLVYSSSFPSGHSLLSATVYLTLGALLGRFVQEFKLKAYFLIVASTLTLLVGLSRVYLGVHWPTDVLAGWCAGLAWATLCWFVARSLQHRGNLKQNAEARDEPSR